jgi:hypothetical protein
MAEFAFTAQRKFLPPIGEPVYENKLPNVAGANAILPLQPKQPRKSFPKKSAFQK